MGRYLPSVVLGVIQGLTEPLPVSSSAHLLLANRLFGLGGGSLAFDAALHIGTALALFIFFWREWLGLFNLQGFRRLNLEGWGAVAVGILPAVIAGLLFGDLVEQYLRAPLVAAAALAAIGVLMWLASRYSTRQVSNSKPVGLERALAVGISQVLALVPGVSRSGITVSSGLLLGLSQEQAFSFSFLMGAPLTLGAGFFQLAKFYSSKAVVDWYPFGIGIGTAFVFGLLGLWLFQKLMSRYSLKPFVVYRLLLAIAVIGFVL